MEGDLDGDWLGESIGDSDGDTDGGTVHGALGGGLAVGCVGAALNAKHRVFWQRGSPNVVVEVGSAVCRKQRASAPKYS